MSQLGEWDELKSVRGAALIVRPETGRDDWSLAAVQLLAVMFLCILAFALWRAGDVDASGSRAGSPIVTAAQPMIKVPDR
jgi:hypothetical protein